MSDSRWIPTYGYLEAAYEAACRTRRNARRDRLVAAEAVIEATTPVVAEAPAPAVSLETWARQLDFVLNSTAPTTGRRRPDVLRAW